ncbi:hypothetical protein HU200_035914 [Digitaria exilis]|uniref:Uncharacterized protein n=1 Tax=Digitaria exilis TaxID=1010633 RepID=A0A835BGP6_9POAL|nr:hypothetical protein HU200_035914 [Digitaria exilis]
MSLARRRREDKWNSIAAGTATFGLVNVHRGARAAARWSLIAAVFFVGIELADLSIDSWHSGLVRSGREIRMQIFLPALVPIRCVSPCRAALGDAADGSVECRSEKDTIPDNFAMERKPKMSSKDA